MHNPGCELLLRGDAPLLIVTPHTGTQIPDALLLHSGWQPVQGRLADPAGLTLHAAAREAGASLISARYHPCFIDFMVSADGRPLAVGVDRGGLCRTHSSRGESLYDSQTPLTSEDVASRVREYWQPFHQSIVDEIQRLRVMHPQVLVFVSHASWWLSPYRDASTGREFNVGTNNGRSCSRNLVSTLTETVMKQGRSWVVNGNIAEVFTAEHYGNPAGGVHVVDVESSGQWRVDCAAKVDEALVDGPPDGAALSTLRRDRLVEDRAPMAPLLAKLLGALYDLSGNSRVDAGGGADAKQL
ncbi:N-formylglutamate amidohydrolase [Caballeronia sordidicola]|uniref:N-formylglutamate amidohydrolase n=1 Tax=Caballeronia sordidicola TaxID=196367 RepID=UPI0015C5D424|nr:N-formylglutamate amidohydrolase [Caballeronia sordidicola]